MKRVKSLALCLVVLTMLLALVGCGKSAPDLSGTYTTEMDMSSIINESMAQAGLAEEDLEGLTLVAPFTLTLSDDGTFTLKLDSDATLASLRTYLEGCSTLLEDVIYDSVGDTDLTREEIDAAFEEETGSTISDYVGQIITMFDEDDLLEMLEEDSDTGYYKATEDKLFLEEDKDDFSDDDYITYTLENGKLTFTELTGDVLDFADAADMIEDFFPLVFTKQ